jgi:chitin synthase
LNKKIAEKLDNEIQIDRNRRNPLLTEA